MPQKSIIGGTQTSSIFETLSSFSQYGFAVQFPKIVVIGNQSAGKSSLTEALTCANSLFEKKTGMATKRPTIITLIKSNEGDDYVKIGNLGEKTYNIEKARQRLFEENDGEITEKPLEITICSTNIHKECIFVDLPGFITATKSEEDSALPKKIREICLPYIKDASNVKVVVMSATEDPALSYALKLVKKHDQMQNSIAVFTKIDMITNATFLSKPVMELLSDKGYIPHLGVVGVKLRSQADIASNISWKDMIDNEKKFIQQYNLDNKGLNFGVPRLMDMVSSEQVKRISHTFPTIKESISKILDDKKKNAGVLRRLIETEDIHEISRELERIITDLHPLSPMRVVLEQSMILSIRSFVRQFITSRYQSHPSYLYTVDRKTVTDSMDKVELAGLRVGARANSLNLEEFDQAKLFSDYLILGECAKEISIAELRRSQRDNLSQSLVTGFVQVVHPSMAPVVTGDKLGNLGWNRVQFTRDLQNMVSSLTTPEFTKETIGIMTAALKDFVLKQGIPSDNMKDTKESKDLKSVPRTETTAELFFVHIFDLICARSNIDDLNQSVTRLIRRENRPFVEYDELVAAAYKRHLKRASSKSPPAGKQPSLFGEDTYPLALHMYSPQMFEAYTDVLIERLSNDLFRVLAVNLLNPIIINTIEVCLKTIKQKDFSKQEKALSEIIGTLEKQLKTLDEMSKAKN